MGQTDLNRGFAWGFFRLAGPLALILAAGCDVAPPSDLELRQEALTAPENPCRSTDLRASKDYAPKVWTDASKTFSPALAFSIPASIPVVQGLSGNHRLTLTLTVGTRNIKCQYEGGSSVPHPTTPEERALALRYVFQSCGGGKGAGDVVSITALNLHVAQGDNRAGRTTVSLVVLEGCPVPTSCSACTTAACPQQALCGVLNNGGVLPNNPSPVVSLPPGVAETGEVLITGAETYVDYVNKKGSRGGAGAGSGSGSGSGSVDGSTAFVMRMQFGSLDTVCQSGVEGGSAPYGVVNNLTCGPNAAFPGGVGTCWRCGASYPKARFWPLWAPTDAGSFLHYGPNAADNQLIERHEIGHLTVTKLVADTANVRIDGTIGFGVSCLSEKAALKAAVENLNANILKYEARAQTALTAAQDGGSQTSPAPTSYDGYVQHTKTDPGRQANFDSGAWRPPVLTEMTRWFVGLRLCDWP